MPSSKKPSTSAKVPVARTKAKADAGFSDEERAAMQERVREMKAERAGASKTDGESEVLAKIAAMPQPDRGLAERIHALVKEAAPGLTSKTWYGMPAYARDGNVICYVQPASKFKAHYLMLGFSDKAHLDDGNVWPVAFAVNKLTSADEARLRSLIKKAVG